VSIALFGQLLHASTGPIVIVIVIVDVIDTVIVIANVNVNDTVIVIDLP